MKKDTIRNLVFTGVLLAIGFVLPFLTGQIPTIGAMISPLHLPVLLCGFLCGWQYGLVCGFTLPLLRSLILTMPPLYPVAIAMAFELAMYGLMAGLLYNVLPKKPIYVYVSLIGAMLTGRMVWGIASFALYTAAGNAFTFEMFLAGAFIKAVPAILIQLILIPILVFALQSAKLIDIGEKVHA